MSEDIAYQQHRYLMMMSIRMLCSIANVVMFVDHLG